MTAATKAPEAPQRPQGGLGRGDEGCARVGRIWRLLGLLGFRCLAVSPVVGSGPTRSRVACARRAGHRGLHRDADGVMFRARGDRR